MVSGISRARRRGCRPGPGAVPGCRCGPSRAVGRRVRAAAAGVAASRVAGLAWSGRRPSRRLLYRPRPGGAVAGSGRAPSAGVCAGLRSSVAAVAVVAWGRWRPARVRVALGRCPGGLPRRLSFARLAASARSASCPPRRVGRGPAHVPAGGFGLARCGVPSSSRVVRPSRRRRRRAVSCRCPWRPSAAPVAAGPRGSLPAGAVARPSPPRTARRAAAAPGPLTPTPLPRARRRLVSHSRISWSCASSSPAPGMPVMPSSLRALLICPTAADSRYRSPNGSAGACGRNALIWTPTTLRMPATGKAVIAWCACASIRTAVMCSARSTCPPVPLPSATSESTFPLSGASGPSASRSASYTRIAR